MKRQYRTPIYLSSLHELDSTLKRLLDTGTSGGDLSLTSVDLNGDGVYEGLGTIRGQGGGTLFYYLLDGQYSTRAVDAQGAIIAADDLDGDGISDRVVATNASNRDGVY
jgi:hypothetical protein